MEREPRTGPPPEPIEPEDATPSEDAEDLPEGPGTVPDTGRVLEERPAGDEGERAAREE